MWNFNLYKTQPALKDTSGMCMSYGELGQAGDEIAEKIGKRCLVFSLCMNSIGSVVGYTAFIRHHIVPVLLSAHLDRELFYSLYETYQPDYIWYPQEIPMDHEHLQGEIILEKYGYYLLKPESCHSRADLYPELGLLLTTSGSTGSPKLVRQSYQNIYKNAEQIVEYLHIDNTERPITTLPMNYTYGLSIINSHLMAGATVFLTDSTIMQKEFWVFLKEEKCTSFGGVPYTYEMLDKLQFYRMELPSLKTLTQAGGKLNVELHRKFAEYACKNGKNFVVMYGQCEATARMAYLPPQYSVEKQGAMGIPIPDGRLELWDEGGRIITEPDKTGELIYKGENVTLGYALCREDLSKGDEFGGILHTGDLAKFDEDGFFYIVGRKKRFLKIFGNRVNLDEAEHLIKKAYQDVECACSGVDDKLCLFLTDYKKAEEIREFVSEKTGLNKTAFKVKIVDIIPKNEAGKVLYSELDKMCE